MLPELNPLEAVVVWSCACSEWSMRLRFRLPNQDLSSCSSSAHQNWPIYSDLR